MYWGSNSVIQNPITMVLKMIFITKLNSLPLSLNLLPIVNYLSLWRAPPFTSLPTGLTKESSSTLPSFPYQDTTYLFYLNSLTLSSLLSLLLQEEWSMFNLGSYKSLLKLAAYILDPSLINSSSLRKTNVNFLNFKSDHVFTP